MPKILYIDSKLGDYVVPVGFDGQLFINVARQIRLSGGIPADLRFVMRGIGMWDEFVAFGRELQRMDDAGITWEGVQWADEQRI
jgi:hypothetical protein